MTEPSTTLKLGYEEIITTLSILGAKGLPGIGLDYLAGQDEEKLRSIYQAGLNSLRARGFIVERVHDQTGQPEYAIDQTLLALVTCCITAPRIVFINRIPRGGPIIPWYVHVGPYLTVIHHSPQTGLHELVASVDAGEVLARVTAFLQLRPEDGVAPAVSLKIPKETYDQIVQLAQDNQSAEAINRLTQVGADADLAALLVKELPNLKATTTLSLIQLTEAENEVRAKMADSLALFQSEQRTWALYHPDEPQVALESIADQQVSSLLCGWLSASSE